MTKCANYRMHRPVLMLWMVIKKMKNIMNMHRMWEEGVHRGSLKRLIARLKRIKPSSPVRADLPKHFNDETPIV